MSLGRIAVGHEIPALAFTPDNAQLFLYNAALWNAHRIHFDHPYTLDVEGYPGLVIPGPLMGDWLAQAVLEWAGDEGELVRFEYSNRRAAYVGDTLHTRGSVVEIDAQKREVVVKVELFNQAEEVLVPARAVVRFAGRP